MTPPKRVTIVAPSTPPLKQNPETLARLQKSVNRSAAKGNQHVRDFTGNSTPKSKKSNRKMDIQDSDSEDEPSRLSQDYEFVRHLGRGNFSSVALYRSKVQGQQFAIKRNSTSKMSVNEIQALATLSMVAEKCPNIIRYFHAWVEKQFTYMVMEYCESSVNKLYNDKRLIQKPLTEEQIVLIGREAANALKYLHANNMAHLDLKPDNLLFSNGVVKLADLGLCRLARVKRRKQLEEGDSRYLAREVLNYTSATDLTKADIFSLGLTLLEGITLLELPNNGELWHLLRNDYKIQQTFYSDRLVRLVESMIASDPGRRPSAEQILTQLKDMEKQYKKLRIFKNEPKMPKTPRDRSL